MLTFPQFPLGCGTPELYRAYLHNIVFSHPGFWKVIASYLSREEGLCPLLSVGVDIGVKCQVNVFVGACESDTSNLRVTSQCPCL